VIYTPSDALWTDGTTWKHLLHPQQHPTLLLLSGLQTLKALGNQHRWTQSSLQHPNRLVTRRLCAAATVSLHHRHFAPGTRL